MPLPRQRQRIVYCDCFDCRDRPEQASLTHEQLSAATAVARQEPPPKALLIYASGFMLAADGVNNLDTCTLPHCDLVVREGNLGLLAVRQAQGAADAGVDAAVSEVAQLLGVYPDVCRPPSSLGGGDTAAAAEPVPLPSLPSLAARYKGMQAGFASTSAPARQLAQQLGMTVVEELCLGAGGAAPAPAPPEVGPDGTPLRRVLPMPDAAAFAGVVAAELGAAEGGSGRDLLLLHLDLDSLLAAQQRQRQEGGEPGAGLSEAGAEAEADARWDAGCEGLEWLDAMLKGLLALPEIRERTMLVLMVSPGGQKMPSVAGQGPAGGGLLQLGGAQLDPSVGIVTPRNHAQMGSGGRGAAAAAVAGSGGALSVLDAEECPLVTRPVQSCELLGMARVDPDVHAPVLVTRRLPGVVRRDRAEKLGYKEALTAGAQGAILVDRLLPEVAYKIARAPKYGA